MVTIPRALPNHSLRGGKIESHSGRVLTASPIHGPEWQELLPRFQLPWVSPLPFVPVATTSSICCWPWSSIFLNCARDRSTLLLVASIAFRHLPAIHFRVSSPDFGARNTLSAAPTPSPATRYLIVDPWRFALSCRIWSFDLGVHNSPFFGGTSTTFTDNPVFDLLAVLADIEQGDGDNVTEPETDFPGHQQLSPLFGGPRSG